jgi:hypothetical protein
MGMMLENPIALAGLICLLLGGLVSLALAQHVGSERKNSCL